MSAAAQAQAEPEPEARTEPSPSSRDLEQGLPPASKDGASKDGASREGKDKVPAEEPSGVNKVKKQAKAKLLSAQKEVQRVDPVKKGRCSLGSLAFLIVGIVGCVFLGIGIQQEDIWEICGSSLVILLSGYSVIFLGGDPCLLEAFRRQVNLFRKENNRFKESNTRLEGELKNLDGVTENLEEVRKKMGEDIDAATRLLQNMQRFSALQTVSVVVNQFFAADWDGSGHVSGDEAQILVPQLSSLWVLVPHFDSERLLQHVKEYGMTLGQLSRLLDQIVADDALGCESELERILTMRKPKPSVSQRELMGPNALEDPAQLEELYEEAASAVKDWFLNIKENVNAAEEEEALKPWFEVGPLTVWSPLHLGLMLTTLAGATFTVAAFVVLELTNIVGGLVGLSLAAGLMAASRLIEVLRALRHEVGTLSGQNDRLEVIHEDLAKQVSHLAKLKKGFDTLKLECGGNVNKARELIAKSNTNTKMSAMAVITRFFKDCDKNRNHTIDADEVDSFVKRLSLAFHSVEGFDAERVRTAATGLSVRELRSLVDIIVTVESPQPAPNSSSVASPTAPPTESNLTGASSVPPTESDPARLKG